MSDDMVKVTRGDLDAAKSVAAQVLHAFRRRDGLTCYVYPDNREREEGYMRDTFEEIVAPLLARHAAAARAEAANGVLPESSLVAERDRFIVSKGLWHEFVGQIPASSPVGGEEWDYDAEARELLATELREIGFDTEAKRVRVVDFGALNTFGIALRAIRKALSERSGRP